ncbi:MAG: class I SAM-dependent methyltransferase [bacterium]|nr:class I SAM-dependent methyltransferase [bacterium]
MNTLEFIVKRYNVDTPLVSPIQLPHGRSELALLFKELGYKVGAEIGVDHGYYSEALCQANPNVKLYCIDPWKVYRKYEDIKDEHDMNKRYGFAKKRLARYNCEIIKKSSTGALKDFKPESLDFVYIDGNHAFDYVMEDLNGWSKIVRKDGIISGHDYKSRRRELIGVGRAVDLYIKEHNIKMLFRLVKNNDSSWFFVNE